MIGHCILVVDDEPTIRNILRRVFLSEGYCVCEAGDGAEAVTAADRCEIDAILMDIKMPRLRGDEAVQRLRADPRFAATPIIIMTGSLDLLPQTVPALMGSTRVLIKPLNLDHLVTTVRQMIQAA